MYFFDKLHIATNFIFSSVWQHNGGLRPNLAHILYLITKYDILLSSLFFSFYIIVQGSIPDPAQKKWQALDVFVIFFGAGDGIRTRDFHLGKVAFYHWITPAYYVD